MKNKKATVKPTFAQAIRVHLIIAALGFLVMLLLSLTYITLRTVDFTDVKMTMLDAQSLLEQLDSAPNAELPTTSNMAAYRDLESIPDHLKKQLKTLKLTHGELSETTFTKPNDEEAYIAIIPLARKNGETVYFVSEYDYDQSNDVYEEILDNFLAEIVWLLAVIFVFLFGFVFWLLKRAVEPMSELSHWAQGLKDKAELAPTEFDIAEVDSLAKQLKQGVDRLNSYNEREKQFLRYASHELRTPQATVQASLDTLQLQLKGSQLKTVERALRANLTMSRLSTALLWLSKESSDPVTKSKVCLATMCDQLIAENNHLITSKGLSINLDCQADTILIERDLLLIVFSNLLRNACQHADRGEIAITITESGLTISNLLCQSGSQNDLENFGLGLHLVNNICDKLDWHFNYTEKNSQVTTQLSWENTNNK